MTTKAAFSPEQWKVVLKRPSTGPRNQWPAVSMCPWENYRNRE
jgi:hypothetical protein